MAVIGVCIQDTPENNRHEMTKTCVNSLLSTIFPGDHRIILIDNGSTDPRTINFLRRKTDVERVRFKRNYFNHAAFNYTFSVTPEDEVAIVVENDIAFVTYGWADFLVSVVRDTSFAAATLIPPDLEEVFSKRVLDTVEFTMFGQTVELGRAWNLWNGCTAFSPEARRAIGHYRPPREGYGYNDPLMSLRMRMSKLEMAQYGGSMIQHLDRGQNREYADWKLKQAMLGSEGYHELVEQYKTGQRDLYEPMNPNIEIEENFYVNYWEKLGPDNIIMSRYLPGGEVEGKRDAIYHAVTEELVNAGAASVLDVGGNQALLGQYFQKMGYEPRYTVADINPHAVQWCKDNGFDATVEDATQLSYRKNQKSAVVLIAVLSHLPGFEDALREAFRVARDIVIVTFWKHLSANEETIRYFPQGFYENTYAVDDIESFAESCGWSVKSRQVLMGNNVPEEMYVFTPATEE